MRASEIARRSRAPRNPIASVGIGRLSRFERRSRVPNPIASVGKSRAAVLRRSERRRFSSASDDEVGGFHARLREQSQIDWKVPASRYATRAPVD
jgi:hypothetical protein